MLQVQGRENSCLPKRQRNFYIEVKELRIRRRKFGHPEKATGLLHKVKLFPQKESNKHNVLGRYRHQHRPKALENNASYITIL
jgi:hypothetical protein